MVESNKVEAGNPEQKKTTEEVEVEAKQVTSSPEKTSVLTADKSAVNKDAADNEDHIEEGAPAQKRQKISETEGVAKEESKNGKAADGEAEEKKEPAGVVADDSEDFEAGGHDDDSFDEDFDADDAEDELPPAEGEDEFDYEAYLKWRQENPDDDGPAARENDPGAELPEGEDSEEEADDYDDEEDD